MPDTVSEVFDFIMGWKPKTTPAIYAVDSLAALSTKTEMEAEDKRGQLRAKEFSQGFRKAARIIRQRNWIMMCSNQIRDTDHGQDSPGGYAIKFYSSLRIKMSYPRQERFVKKTLTIKGVKHERPVGIKATCEIIKSSIDDPFRYAPVFIMFNYGIDDVRGNLFYNKWVTGADKYVCGKKEFA